MGTSTFNWCTKFDENHCALQLMCTLHFIKRQCVHCTLSNYVSNKHLIKGLNQHTLTVLGEKLNPSVAFYVNKCKDKDDSIMYCVAGYFYWVVFFHGFTMAVFYFYM